MTTFLPFASHAALQHVATAPSTERDAAIAELIVAPFQGMFAQMVMGGGIVRGAPLWRGIDWSLGD